MLSWLVSGILHHACYISHRLYYCCCVVLCALEQLGEETLHKLVQASNSTALSQQERTISYQLQNHISVWLFFSVLYSTNTPNMILIMFWKTSHRAFFFGNLETFLASGSKEWEEESRLQCVEVNYTETHR